MRKKISGKNNKIKAAIVIATLLVVIGAVALFNFKTAPAIEFQKGMGYAGWSKDAYNSDDSDISLQRVKETGANWASVLVTWSQTNCWSGDIHKTAQTPSDESVARAIRKAHELGMKVMLKLHLDLVDQSDGSWRGEIGCVKDADWDLWFAKYNDYVMYYVNIANKERVEMICVGTELSATDGAKGYMWRELIKKVRQKYHGSLTYAAHWDRYQDIRFWDLLDYIGINAYFPLTDQMDPTYDQLKEGWKKWADEMEVFQKDVKKPIIFPEVGCNSADGAAIRPWEHMARTEVNIELQARYYKVLMDIFWEKPWFYGLYWWYWGTNENMGGKYDRGFTPQNKPAQEVVKERYVMPVGKNYVSK